MSGLPLTDIARLHAPVRSVPQPDSCTAAIGSSLFDHFIGAREQRLWDRDPQRRGRLQVDDQLELGRRLHGKVAWLLTFQNTVNVLGRTAIGINLIRSIGDEASLGDPPPAGKDRG